MAFFALPMHHDRGLTNFLVARDSKVQILRPFQLHLEFEMLNICLLSNVMEPPPRAHPNRQALSTDSTF
jgi:hypothetical protein